MARRKLSIWEIEQKEQFEKMVKEFSIKGLQNIISIANTAFDQRVRFQANQFLVQLAVGKDFRAFGETETEQRELNLKLTVVEGNKIDCDEVEEMCRAVENNLLDDELKYDDKWNTNPQSETDDDSWGEDIFCP